MYKRGFVIFGVVSLTMGNSGFPVGNGLARDVDLFRQLLLRKRERGAMRLDLITEFHKLPPVRFVRSAPRVTETGKFVEQSCFT